MMSARSQPPKSTVARPIRFRKYQPKTKQAPQYHSKSKQDPQHLPPTQAQTVRQVPYTPQYQNSDDSIDAARQEGVATSSLRQQQCLTTREVTTSQQLHQKSRVSNHATVQTEPAVFSGLTIRLCHSKSLPGSHLRFKALFVLSQIALGLTQCNGRHLHCALKTRASDSDLLLFNTYPL
jgi:hypothetical protein